MDIIVGTLILVIGAIAHFAPAALWQHALKFCEKGILWDQRVLPWDELIEHQWTGARKHHLELYDIDAPANNPWEVIPVPPERKAEIEALLAKMAPQISLAWARARRVGLGQVPISSVYRARHLRRHLGHAIAGALCGAGLWLLAILRPTGMREFDEALHFGLLIVVFVAASGWRWIGRNAGPLNVRLFARRDWIGLIANVAGAIAVYLLADQLVWRWGWLGYAGGLAFWVMVFNAAAYFIWTQLDLRKNGIVIPRALYWRWANVDVVEWDREKSGRLVFRRGYRRVFAIVPPEQREAVDALLREKLSKDLTN